MKVRQSTCSSMKARALVHATCVLGMLRLGGAWAVGAAAAAVAAVAAAASCGFSAMVGYAAGRKRSEPPSPGAHPQTQLV